MRRKRRQSGKRLDPLSPGERSDRMSRVRCKDTKLEMLVRRLVHGMGYRYRLHSRSLPGHPDMVFPGRRKVIFVHGCFWHLHKGCRQYRLPRSKTDFWLPKLRETKRRDERQYALLREEGWDVMVVWECETKDASALARRIVDFLGGAQ